MLLVHLVLSICPETRISKMQEENVIKPDHTRSTNRLQSADLHLETALHYTSQDIVVNTPIQTWWKNLGTKKFVSCFTCMRTQG